MCVACASLSFAPAAPAQVDQSTPTPESPSPFDAQLAEALAQFNGRHYAQALTLFDALQARTTDSKDRATLGFNAAVCSFALGDFQSARRRFEAVAQSSPDLAATSLLHAGLAALRMGDRNGARNYLNAVPTPTPAMDSEVRKRRQQLLAELLAAEHEERVVELQTRLDTAHDAIEDGQYEVAQEQLRQAGSFVDVASMSDKADLEYYLGLVDYEQGNWASSRRHLDLSLRLRPGQVEALFALVRVCEADHDAPCAATAYERVLNSKSSAAKRANAEHALRKLYHLPTGPSGFGALSLGYDTNADFTGVGEVIAAGSSQHDTSAFLSATLDASYAFRTSRRTEIAPFYRGDLFALFNPAVNDLSLQTHEIGVSVGWAPSFNTTLELAPSVASNSLGTHPITQFTWEGGAAGKLTVLTSDNSRARFQVAMLAINAAHLDYLDGSRLTASADERWQLDLWDLTVQLRGSYFLAGIDQDTTSNVIVNCGADPNCSQPYLITYSYWSSGVGAVVGWDATAALHLSLAQRVDYRGYVDASGVLGAANTQKFRKDWELGTQARVELALDDEDTVQLAIDQGLLVSRSNLAQGSAGLSHQFDYADRNFVQSTSELGVEVSW